MKNYSRILFLLFLLINWQHFTHAVDYKFIYSLLTPLYKLMHAQDSLLFLSERLDKRNTEQLEDFTISIYRSFGVPQMIIKNRTDFRLRESVVRKNYLGLVFTTGPDDPILDLHHKVLIGRKYSFNMIIMLNVVANFSVVEQFVRDMALRNLQSVLYVYNAQNISALWGYEPYPTFSIVNRTDFFAYIRAEYKLALSGGLDVKGYKYYTPLRLDVPHVFQHEKEFQGVSYKIIKLFMDYTNGTMVPYKMPLDSLGGQVVDMASVLNLVREQTTPIAAHAYALFAIDDDIDKSYPIMVVKWCLMVPIRNSVSTFYYPVQPFSDLVWYAVIAAFIGLFLLDLIWLLFQHSLAGAINCRIILEHFQTALLDDLCYILNIAATKTLRTPAPLRFIVFACTFYHGFFLNANYTSLLGSILTVTLFRGEINTIDDLITANISVMIIDYELEFLLTGKGALDLPFAFWQLLRSVDVATFAQHQNALNTSYAYFVTDDKWTFLSRQQGYLKHGLFKFTDICFGSYHLAFPMQTDLPIWRTLEYFLYRIHSSGLRQHYETTSFDYAVHAGLMNRLVTTNEYTSAGMDHLMMVFMLLVLVFAISFIILLLECLWFKRWSNK